MERVHDDRPPAREQRGSPPDGTRLGRVRVDDVGADGTDDAREPPGGDRVADGESSRDRPGSCTTETPARCATNAIDSSPRATSPATSVVS